MLVKSRRLVISLLLTSRSGLPLSLIYILQKDTFSNSIIIRIAQHQLNILNSIALFFRNQVSFN